MSTTTPVDDIKDIEQFSPGLSLSESRKQLGYSQEYVANKLHLRVRIIDLLENDDYQSMPEPVFIRGYLRAYSKLLNISPEPLISQYNITCGSEKKIDKALWQSRRESNNAEKMVRWITLIFALSVIVAIGIWWQKNKDSHDSYAATANHLPADLGKSDVRLTDLSKMQSLLSNNADIKPVETNGG